MTIEVINESDNDPRLVFTSMKAKKSLLKYLKEISTSKTSKTNKKKAYHDE